MTWVDVLVAVAIGGALAWAVPRVPALFRRRRPAELRRWWRYGYGTWRPRWWQWVLPRRGADEYGRMTLVQHVPPFGFVVWAYRTCPDCRAEIADEQWRQWLRQSEDARRVLIDHQRHECGGCLCGWNTVGASHADHVLAALERARVPAANGHRR